MTEEEDLYRAWGRYRNSDNGQGDRYGDSHIEQADENPKRTIMIAHAPGSGGASLARALLAMLQSGKRKGEKA